MTWLTFDQLFRALVSAGCFRSTAEKLAGIALAETGKLVAVDDSRSLLESVGDKDIVNDTWWWSYGPWQIRSKRDQRGTGGLRDQERLERFDLADHARIARAIVLEDRAWRPTGLEGWSTYTSGAFWGYMPGRYVTIPELPAGTYRVKGGDSIWAISRKLGYDQGDLVKVNRLDDPNLIRAGAVLMLPDYPYVWRKGDTVADIAAANHISEARLRSYARIGSGTPKVGAVVKVPRLP